MRGDDEYDIVGEGKVCQDLGLRKKGRGRDEGEGNSTSDEGVNEGLKGKEVSRSRKAVALTNTTSNVDGAGEVAVDDEAQKTTVTIDHGNECQEPRAEAVSSVAFKDPCMIDEIVRFCLVERYKS